MSKVDYNNLVADCETDDELERIIEQVDQEVIEFERDYHNAG